MNTSIGFALMNIFKEPILKKAKELSEEYAFIYENGLVKYINNYYDKFSNIKTFIYRDQRIPFYDVYFPVNIKSNQEHIQDIQGLIDDKRYISITGSAGSGKSMLTKHIFISNAKGCKSVPILVELRQLNTFDGTIEDLINAIITDNKISPSNKITNQILSEGNFIFILDGYDEIFSNNKQKITNEIENFVDRYSNNKFVITARPGAGIESFQRFDNYNVCNLDNTEIKEFINLQFENHENKEIAAKIIEEIAKPSNRHYKHYLSSPLLLSMFIFTFSNYPELPKQQSKFYWNVFDTLCTRHDSFSKTGGWQHERKSGLKNDELEKILLWLSYLTLFEGKYNFDYHHLSTIIKRIIDKINITGDLDKIIYDLSTSLSILIVDGTEYTYPHKSLQEYFTAMLIKSLDDNQKQNVYSKQFEKFNLFTSGGNSSFYKLCLELDKVSFLKYYLIPELKSSYKFDIQNDNEKVKYIIKLLSFGFAFQRTGNSFRLKSVGYSASDINTLILENANFITYFNTINEMIDINKDFVAYLHSLKEVRLDFEGNMGVRISQSNFNTDKVLDFFTSQSVIKSFIITYEDIKNSIKDLENFIIEDEKGTLDLLDI
ncbi:NACHT domain-containing protein [Chryseobacterium sp. WG14]|uniref:NACHT domain-containing protein n=1 Tax=Chryseobacterium sp. WG14 TaxID=2926909 RepID=UPI00211EFB06|nr:NACHT domain-containing protein [Chryseobacterium sp. WG14]MCQ9639763.1 NACHT domain-containing protein [Chryseobacterium sp. WG14]